MLIIIKQILQKIITQNQFDLAKIFVIRQLCKFLKESE